MVGVSSLLVLLSFSLVAVLLWLWLWVLFLIKSLCGVQLGYLLFKILNLVSSIWLRIGMLFRISIRSAIFLFTITFYPKLTSYLVKIDHISIHCLIIWFYLFSWTQTISWIILIFWSIFAMRIKWFLIILVALIKQNIVYL